MDSFFNNVLDSTFAELGYENVITYIWDEHLTKLKTIYHESIHFRFQHLISIYHTFDVV